MSYILRNRSRLSVQGYTQQNCKYLFTATVED